MRLLKQKDCDLCVWKSRLKSESRYLRAVLHCTSHFSVINLPYRVPLSAEGGHMLCFITRKLLCNCQVIVLTYLRVTVGPIVFQHQVLSSLFCTQDICLNVNPSLARVAQWFDLWPANQRVTGLIPSQGTCLGCGPGPL